MIVDTDPDRIAAAVRGSGDALPAPTLIARNGDDAIRLLAQFGAPAVLIAALALPGREGLTVIESLRRIDGDAPVIAWAEDRELREYAVNRLAGSRAKVLSRPLSAELCRQCVHALVGGPEITSVAPTVRVADAEENWFDLAERARQRLGVAGAAAYTRARGATEYRVSASWRPDAPVLHFPAMLPSAIEDVMANGVARMWPDLADESAPSSRSVGGDVALRSLAIVPIVRDGDVAGALCAFDPEPRAFRRHDLETLSAFAGRSTARIPGPPSPIDRGVADTIIQSELARVGRDQLPASVILFAVTTVDVTDSPAIDEMLAAEVRGNDLVVRWTSSEMLVVLTGVDDGIAQRVAERIRGAVETTSANQIALSGAVTNLRATDSLGDVVARASIRPASRSFG
jgi:CheY-like chemotaxis protein